MAGSPPTPRTTAALVKGIVEVQDGVDLTPYIASANILATDVCGNSGYSDGYDGSKLELIERWLAAHFYTVFDPQLTSAKASTVAVGYQNKVGFGLFLTPYGQQAMLLDTAQNLAKLENSNETVKKVNVGMDWLGIKRRHLEIYGPDAEVTVEQ